MRNHKLFALVAGALLWTGLAPLAAQEPQEPPEGQEAEQTPTEEKGFSFRVDSFVLSYENVDNDTDSAKFFEYRDFDDGALGFLDISGRGGDDRFLDFNASRIGRDDGRYTFGYGVVGRYSLGIDYNQIVHNFANNGRLLWTRSGNRYFLPDELQRDLQTQITANQSRLNFAFLNGLIQPYIANAHSIDVGLTRDRLLARLDLGRTSAWSWGLEYFQEERDGTRQFGGSFGFNNVTELPEPVEYTTRDAEFAGEWNGKNAGVRFGYRMSTFDNDVDTLYFDNPWRITDSTDPGAYQAPSTSSIGGAALGFADLAPDNEANQLFLSGRARAGTWFFNGGAAMINMTQDDPLLPYTLNTAIRGINFDGSTFDPTNPANLPARNADTEVDVTTLNGQAGTDLGENFDLTFRYRYYDYDNKSRRIEFPGYVRYHGVWEEIARITVPYAYTRQDASAEFGWDIGTRSRLALSYGLQLWDREFREVESSDEDILRLSFDTRPLDRLTLRARYETGDRSIDGYDVEAGEDTFLHPEAGTQLPGLRQYSQAAREYDDYNLQAQWFATDTWNVTAGVTGRKEDYDESEFGLISDEILQYNAEVAYTPGENLNLYVFGQWADREVFQRSRQSGATPSTNPLDTWFVDFDEDNYLLGAGFTTKFAERFTLDVQARQTESDGFADFTAFPGGAPLASPPRTAAQDFDNYEDIELTSVLAKLGYQLNKRFSVGFSYLWEDYTIDSFIVQDLQFYLPGALLINGNNYDYDGQVFRLDLGISF
ncbi:MAG TPA: MtrB/PioB family outer membrane beta-barrel protein [Thermoanaerobaculia bacterium]|nr:MtrB/PioB family outer membrane beta-barrel protein [Thermoanaerobaculia bacterium]